MSNRKMIAVGLAALVLGLAIGGVGTATAATSGATSSNPIVAGACGLGLKMGAAVRDSGGRLADVVAKLTGTTVADVTSARASGDSFAEIAKAKGVSSDKVVATALGTREKLLEAKVKDGTITQAQADTALKNMETRLTERVSSTTPGCGTGGGQGTGGRGMGGGRGAGGGGGSCTQTTVTQ
jgi:hypothetical protein